MNNLGKLFLLIVNLGLFFWCLHDAKTGETSGIIAWNSVLAFCAFLNIRDICENV